MLIAIVHYHLNRGGVTQVIANHLRGLHQQDRAGALRVVVLHGGRAEGWPDLGRELAPWNCVVRVVPGLDYDAESSSTTSCPARELAARLRQALLDAGGTPDASVLHVHNHSLGKNTALPAALAELAAQGWPLLLQIHDFAEDFRPQNYRQLQAVGRGQESASWAAPVYPQAGHVHYATLNQRDTRILRAAGVEPARVHGLPNPVGDPGPLPPREPARRKLSQRFGVPEQRPLLLYPIRGIRRKNLGEALLWSALAGGAWHLGITLPPLNPIERPAYERWKSLAARLGLPVAFEIGGETGLTYAENLAASDRMLTTSVAEGFGLVFLESWLAGRLLSGRDLPEITADFRAAGLRLDDLHPRLVIPLEWIGAEAWRSELEGQYRATLAQFGRSLPPPDEFRRQRDALTEAGVVDFGFLGSQQQRQVVELAAGSEPHRRQLFDLNPWVQEALRLDRESGPGVRENAGIVRRGYSLEACGRRLAALYGEIVTAPRTSPARPLDGERILDEFLHLSRFHPVRVES